MDEPHSQSILAQVITPVPDVRHLREARHRDVEIVEHPTRGARAVQSDETGEVF